MQIIRKPGSVLANHLSSPSVTAKIKRICSKFWRETTDKIIRLNLLPCNRQGLPFYNVTIVNCELLPHSFHPCSTKVERYCFCGTFPRVSPGCR